MNTSDVAVLSVIRDTPGISFWDLFARVDVRPWALRVSLEEYRRAGYLHLAGTAVAVPGTAGLLCGRAVTSSRIWREIQRRPVTVAELARQLGTRPTIVSRALIDLRRRGWVYPAGLVLTEKGARAVAARARQTA